MGQKESNDIPSPHIDSNEPLPGQISAQEACLKIVQKHRSSESENAQESGSSIESSSNEDAQESQPSKQKHKKVTVVKTKEYKIPRHKKCTTYEI